MTTLDEIPFVSSPLNEETLIKFPIESNLRKDLTKMKNTCNNILKMFQDAKSNRDLFDKTINIVNIGNDILLEIQQIIDGSQNSFELKKEIEESPAFQKYSDCISKFETFNQSNPTDEVRREISGLNDELEILTNELRELFNRWKSDRTGWNGKIKKKFKAIAKMASLRKSVSIFEKEIRPYELKLDFIKPIVPSVTVGSKHHITKGFYASTSVAIKVVGNFESGDPKLLELKNEIEFLKNFHNCDHILDV
ncbi:hypothetical protein C1645_842554 [Glomus cerebriforme]|uniref:Protein kinase domain-containing protein n=1 Tax=Glomus cerebriforme TaxID=658196 RepID=A0A397S420_9GLOM|nr:hypothetical protein C1645_842554 [Glomus cerebriforme]